jgi:hypothetical protein
MIGWPAAPVDGEIAEKDGKRVRQHVPGIAEESKAVADETTHDLHDHEGEGEGKDQKKLLFPFHEVILAQQ